MRTRQPEAIDKLHKLTRGPAGKSQAESSGNNKLQILVTEPRCSFIRLAVTGKAVVYARGHKPSWLVAHSTWLRVQHALSGRFRGVYSRGAGMTFWSTDTIPERERFSFWREIICDTIFSISPEAPSERFSARVRVRSSGPLRFAMCQSTSYEIIRTQRDVNRAPADYYTVYLQLQGQTFINQCNDSAALDCNDIVLSDCRRPYSAMLSNDGLRAVAVLPRPMVNSRAPWLAERALHKIPASSQYIDLARRHMIQLMSEKIGDGETDLLTENLCNLLALASAPDIPPSRLRTELQIAAMLTFCRQNLHRAELSPQLVASHFSVSLRTVHSRFERLGTTFGRWLLETRLDACSKVLKGQRRHHYISEIAYNCGFNDLSHFNKAFRARFEMAPTEWRNKYANKQ